MIASLSIKLFIIVEVIVAAVFIAFHQRDWEAEDYLTRIKAEPAHSLYTMARYTSPHYSWFHGTDTKLSLANLNP